MAKASTDPQNREKEKLVDQSMTKEKQKAKKKGKLTNAKTLGQVPHQEGSGHLVVSD